MVEVGRRKARGKEEENKTTGAMQSGAWLTAVPNHMNGTALSAEEFGDNLRLRYGIKPLHLPLRRDGCGAKFTTEHGLTCPKGGL
eukprot:11903269-Ditylum_brightwellii.AAC.1